MHDPHVHNEQTFWSANFISALYTLGLRHVIISPGSRSTPLALAFATHPGIKKHVVLDERSAAFIALGIGMETGSPAALVCTSGTAVANYFPAVIESKMSEIPMLILSADRPADERDSGANQAIDQIQLFGNKAVYFYDLKTQNSTTESLGILRDIAQNAWNSSINLGGCSHINFPFRKPLEPDADFLNDLKNWYLNQQRPPFESKTINGISLDVKINTLINRSKRPVVLCGPSKNNLAVANLVEYFSKFRIPILIEPGSTNRDLNLSINETRIPLFNAFLRKDSNCKDLAPDLIIKIGGEPVGKGVELYLNYHNKVQSIHFNSYTKISNPAKLPQIRIPIGNGVLESTKPALEPEEHWLNKWIIKSHLASNSKNSFSKVTDKLKDGDVHTILSQNISSDDILMVSNSFPVRDMDLFGMPKVGQNKVYMNRGASGIDGITSTAIGLSLASNRPIYLITGDLAFLHDLNALLSLKLINARFIIVVINNNGGSIFRMLPAKKLNTYFEEYFETPQHMDIQKICASFNISSYKVSNYKGFQEVLHSNEFDKPTVIECITDADLSMEQRINIWDS
jgi:2-succinyl-5-enolpyruvyl-6-hydroxy-3-cyclohexene-1-carboxylate synthase